MAPDAARARETADLRPACSPPRDRRRVAPHRRRTLPPCQKSFFPSSVFCLPSSVLFEAVMTPNILSRLRTAISRARDDVVISAVPPVSDTGPSPFRIPVSAIAIIPARYHSSRLPGKALADIAGRPMIEHVYRRAAAAASVSRVIVATDDGRIVDAVRAFGGEAVMTSPAHQSGTDR